MIDELEAAGATLRLDGQKVRVWCPNEERRRELDERIAFLRRHRDEVAAFLRARDVMPTMPPGVRLIEWKLKEPPVAIETCAVVPDPALFARIPLEQLWTALSQPKRWVGW